MIVQVTDNFVSQRPEPVGIIGLPQQRMKLFKHGMKVVRHSAQRSVSP